MKSPNLEVVLMFLQGKSGGVRGCSLVSIGSSLIDEQSGELVAKKDEDEKIALCNVQSASAKRKQRLVSVALKIKELQP